MRRTHLIEFTVVGHQHTGLRPRHHPLLHVDFIEVVAGHAMGRADPGGGDKRPGDADAVDDPGLGAAAQ